MDTCEGLNPPRSKRVRQERCVGPDMLASQSERLKNIDFNFHDLAPATSKFSQTNKSSLNVYDSVHRDHFINNTSLSHQRNHTTGDEFPLDRSQHHLFPATKTNTIIESIPTLTGYPQPRSSQQYKAVRWSSFGTVCVVLAILLAGTIILEVFLMLKLVQLKSKLLESSKQRERLENSMISDLQSNLVAHTLEVHKVESVGSEIQASLSANIIKIHTLEDNINQRPKFYYGNAPTGAWQIYTTDTLYQTVDISQHKFKNPPQVLISISGYSSHWMLIGSTSVYGITKDSFTVYIHGSVVTLANSIALNWKVQYVLVSKDP